MAEPQQQADPNVERVKGLFVPHDPQMTGNIPSNVFGQVLTGSGFTFSPKMQHNLLSLVDDGNGQVSFGAFMWLWNLLSALGRSFHAKAQGQPQLPANLLKDVLTELNYKFADKTFLALSVMADPNKTGSLNFEDASKVIAFIIFSNNLFGVADQSKTGKLTLAQLTGQLPYLGITNVQPGQAEGLFAKFDADKSGTLEFDEFVALALALRFPNVANLL